MSDTDLKVFLGQNQNDFAISPKKLNAFLDSPLISDEINLSSATGATDAVEVPAGAIVKQVGLLCTATVSGGSGDVDVGDGTVADRFIDGLATMVENEIVFGPNGNSDEVGGVYYSTQTTIKVTVNGTPSQGCARVLVWYDIDDTGVLT